MSTSLIRVSPYLRTGCPRDTLSLSTQSKASESATTNTNTPTEARERWLNPQVTHLRRNTLPTSHGIRDND
ncbi:hypothetical protein MAHJHV63_49320 [Mycobacterium avium subsp. hominissuis]